MHVGVYNEMDPGVNGGISADILYSPHDVLLHVCLYRCTYYVVIVDNNYIAKVLSIESPCLLIKVLQTTRLGELDNVNKHIIFVQV